MISPQETRPAAVARPLAAEHARAIVEAIHERVEQIRDLVLELYEREGWKSLGYESWEKCVTAEFDRDRSYLYRQLRAAMIEREIAPSKIDADPKLSPMGDKSTLMGSREPVIPERQLRPLAELPEGHRKEAWEEARATAPDGKVTAKHVQATVDRRLGKSVVNGREMPDPPDVAKKRAEGRIEPDTVVEVIEPEPEPRPSPRPSPSRPRTTSTMMHGSTRCRCDRSSPGRASSGSTSTPCCIGRSSRPGRRSSTMQPGPWASPVAAEATANTPTESARS
jgi:hypothetical protein